MAMAVNMALMALMKVGYILLMCVCVFMYVCMYVCMYACMYVRVVCACVCAAGVCVLCVCERRESVSACVLWMSACVFLLLPICPPNSLTD